MSSFTRTQPDGTWITAYVPPRTDYEDLDAKQFASVNGDKGGCWAPSSAITLNGTAGAGPVLRVEGTTEVSGAGVLDVTDIVFNSFPKLAPGHAGTERTILSPTIGCHAVGNQFVPAPSSVAIRVPGIDWTVGVNRQYCGVQPLALTLRNSGGHDSPIEFVVPLRVHNESTLDQVTFRYRVPSLRSQGPKKMPRFRIFRVNATGVAENLKSTKLNDGFDSPVNPGSAEDWFAGGGAQEFVYVCDQNNEIDISQYCYFAHIVEETGADSYPDLITICDYDIIRLASTRPISPGPVQTANAADIVDGTSISNYTFLLKDEADARDNGIWFIDFAGAPVPIRRYSDAEHPVNGSIFLISAGFNPPSSFVCGDHNGATVWQVQFQAPLAQDKSFISFNRPTYRGNIYLPIELHFTGITDTRFQ